MKFVFFDTETTHLSVVKGDIIEIAIVTEIDGQITERYHTKIQPERIKLASPYALKINGYSELAWSGAPTWETVAPEIASRLRDGILVGHNISFDLRHIIHQMQRHKTQSRLSGAHICTMSLAREHLPTPSVSMDTIRWLFGWPTEGAHTALVDTLQTRDLFKRVYRCSVWDRLFYKVLYLWRKNTELD